MKAKELIKILEQNPEFNVEFVFCDKNGGLLDYRSFDNLDVADIGHSDKTIVLTGDEISK